MTDPRPSFETYYLDIAKAVAGRADCVRALHGAIVVKDNRICSAGYNGAPSGQPGCLTAGACPRGKLEYHELPSGSSYDTGPGACIALHAEANALLRATWDDLQGATLYITGSPCGGCWKQIQGTPLVRVVYPGASFRREGAEWVFEETP